MKNKKSEKRKMSEHNEESERVERKPCFCAKEGDLKSVFLCPCAVLVLLVAKKDGRWRIYP